MIASPARRRRNRAGTALVGVVASLVGLLALAGVALAHADLLTTTPANQAVLDSSPPEILLEFSEAIDPIDPAIRLVDGSGDEIEIGNVDQANGADTLRADVPDELAQGTYVVGWQAVSADSHRIRGAFTFSVGEATGTDPGLIEGLFDAEPAGRSDQLFIGVGRFLSYAGIAVLVGALVMAAVLFPTRLATRRTGRILWIAWAIAVVGTVWMIVAQTHLLTGSFMAWGDLADTRSGRWWFLRLLAVVGYGLVLVPLRRHWVAGSGSGPAARGAGPSPLLVVPFAAGLGLFAIAAAGGHAITGSDVAVGMIMTVVHIAAMSVWLGSITLLALGTPRGEMWTSAARVSPWAFGSVVVLAVSGAVNAWRQLGSFDALTDSAYGRWLVVKLVLVVAVVAVAGYNRWLLRERVGDEADGRLRRSVVVELVGMGLVLMATAGLANTAPPPDEPEIASASAVIGDRIAQIELDPAVTGGTELHVYLTSPGGGLDRADEITVTAELPSAGLGPIEIDTLPAGPNHVIGTNADLPVAGLWTFEVTARYGEFDQIVFTLQLQVDD